jgi:hypothetical protein
MAIGFVVCALIVRVVSASFSHQRTKLERGRVRYHIPIFSIVEVANVIQLRFAESRTYLYLLM